MSDLSPPHPPGQPGVPPGPPGWLPPPLPPPPPGYQPAPRHPTALWAALGVVVAVATGAVAFLLIGRADDSTSLGGGPRPRPTVSVTSSAPVSTTTDEPVTVDDAGGLCADGDAVGCDVLHDWCNDGDLSACDVLWLTSPEGSSDEAFGNSCGSSIDLDFQGGCSDFIEPGGECLDGLFSGCEYLANSCNDGDMIACDVLYLAAPAGSDYEAFSDTCGGRTAESFAATCAEYFE